MWVLCLAALAWPLGAQTTTAWRLNAGEAQLFLDDVLLAAQSGVRRTVRQPTKDRGGREPVIAIASTDAKGRTQTQEANGTIVFDPRLRKYVMFAVAFTQLSREWDRARVMRYTSTDALRWVAGDDGRPQQVLPSSPAFLEHESGARATYIDMASFHYDVTDPVTPYKGWVWFMNMGAFEGLYYVSSPDGRTWTRGAAVMLADQVRIGQDGRQMGGPFDASSFSWDPVERRYLANLKFMAMVNPPPGNRLRARAFVATTDLQAPIPPWAVSRLALIPPGEESRGEGKYDEYYHSSAWRYGAQWVGGLKIWHGKDAYPHSAEGSAFLELVTSRDGFTWQEVPYLNDDGIPEVWIPNGPEGGHKAKNDGGYITEFTQGPLRIRDELIYYYGASSWGKNPVAGESLRLSGGGIFRARLRPEGFVSVDAGTITTVPLAFPEPDLFLNARGPVQVAVVDDGGRVLAETTVRGDGVRLPVRFGGRSLGEVVPDRTAALRFVVEPGASLFAFFSGRPGDQHIRVVR